MGSICKAYVSILVISAVFLFQSGCVFHRELVGIESQSADSVKCAIKQDVRVGQVISVTTDGIRTDHLKVLEINYGSILVKKWGLHGGVCCAYRIRYEEIDLIELEKLEIKDRVGTVVTGLLVIFFLIV